MNKNLLLIAIAVGLNLLSVGCNKSGKLSEHSTFKFPTGPVLLTLKWPVGEHIVQDLDMKQSMEFSLPIQPGPIHQDMTLEQEYGLTVLQATPDGGHEVELEFLSVRTGMSMGGKTILDYDSTKRISTNAPDPTGEAFGKLIGAKIRYFLDATNSVTRMEGLNELMSRLPADAPPQVVASFKTMFSDSYFKQLMSANRFLPAKPVQPGDTWPVQIEFPMGGMGTLLMNYDFTFQSWELHGRRNCARLDFQATMKSKPGSESNPSGMSISDLDGTSAGSCWFDPELGIVIDTSTTQDMKMVMHVPNPGRGKNASSMQNITSELHQVMNIKLVSVK